MSFKIKRSTRTPARFSALAISPSGLRGTQRIVSVNYLFGRPLISSDFLETIVTLNFRDMRNLMSVAFGLSKLSFLVPKKGQLSFSERREDLKFSGLDKNIPNKFENTQVPLEYPNR